MSRAPITESNSPRFRPTRARLSSAVEGRPACPRYLSKPARQRFRQICKELELRKCLTRGDGELIALTCTTWERWREAMIHVETEGAVVEYVTKGKNDEVITRERKNLYLTIAQEAEKTLIACYDRLGFSPLNRDRAKPVQKEKPKVDTRTDEEKMWDKMTAGLKSNKPPEEIVQ
jgi:P27 family predicted phage terminase small subunit